MASSMKKEKMKEQSPKVNDEKMCRKDLYRQIRLQEAISDRQKRLQDVIAKTEPYEMNLGKMELEDMDMEIVVEEAIKAKQCTVLILEDNKITPDGFTCIIDALKSGTSLKVLRLSRNPIGDDGAALLAELLHNKPNVLTDLWMNDTALTNRGVQLLIEALEHPKSTLKILDLSDNKTITDESVEGIVEMLMVNNKLDTLRYNGVLSQKAQNHLKEISGERVTTSNKNPFATPGTYSELRCKGRPCTSCGKCRDWRYTGDSDSWHCIRNVANWKQEDVNCYVEENFNKRFIKRDGATCTPETYYKECAKNEEGEEYSKNEERRRRYGRERDDKYNEYRRLAAHDKYLADKYLAEEGEAVERSQSEDRLHDLALAAYNAREEAAYLLLLPHDCYLRRVYEVAQPGGEDSEDDRRASLARAARLLATAADRVDVCLCKDNTD